MTQPEPFTAEGIEALQRLPDQLLRAGYIDAFSLYGPIHLRREVMERELEAFDPTQRALLNLFALAREAPLADLTDVIPQDALEQLGALGILIHQGDLVHAEGLTLMPLLGQLVFVPAPRHDPFGFFGHDTAAIAVRISPRPGARTLDLCAGPGLLAVRAAGGGAHVTAVESNPVALGCLELNRVMHNLEDRIEIREGHQHDALAEDERFDHVIVSPPLMPFPEDLDPGEDGTNLSEAEWLILRLPEVLNAGGVAQVVSTGLGDSRGPRILHGLQMLAEECNVRISVTVSAQAPMHIGSTTRAAMAWGVAHKQGVSLEQIEGRFDACLARMGCDRLFLFYVTLDNSGRRDPGVSVHRPDTMGQGFWFR